MSWPAWLRFSWQYAPVRYVVVGTANTGFAYAVYAAALWVGCAYPLASLIALVAGTCVSFKTQGRLVFRNARNALFGRFVVSLAFVYLSNVAIIAMFVHLHFGALAAGAAALPFNIAIGYALQRFFVFRERTHEAG